MGPASASQADLQQLALAKLKARLAREERGQLPENARYCGLCVKASIGGSRPIC